MTHVAWVVGRGGMLGSRMARALAESGCDVWHQSGAFPWQEDARVVDQMAERTREFATSIRSTAATRWTVVWAAGAGTVGSTPQSLAAETRMLTALLQGLDDAAELWNGCEGAFFFASSAGTIYGNADNVLTEESPTVPVSPYGREKLVQETLLRQWASAHPRSRVLLARITNLYGEGQDMRKAQGIISHVARSILLRRPVHIYVPFDTARDYVYAGDCATHAVACMERLWAEPAGVTVKLLAAQRVTTLADIIGTFARVAKRPPLVMYDPSRSPLQHARSIRFRSIVWPELLPQVTPLCAGIHRVLLHQLSLLGQGRLR